MFDPKIKISKDLYDKLTKRAEAEGYSSVDEFAQHVLEKAAGPGEKQDEDLVAKRLRGLGYLE